MFERFSAYDQSLLAQFRRLEQEMDQLFGDGMTWSGARNIRSLPSGAFPAVNVGATPDEVLVYLFAPGLDAKTLDISLHQNLLSVSGRREVPVRKDATYYRQERFSGGFRRAITLPEDVDPDKVEAKYMDGIVRITLGRRASAKPRQIQIQ